MEIGGESENGIDSADWRVMKTKGGVGKPDSLKSVRQSESQKVKGIYRSDRASAAGRTVLDAI